MEKESQQSSSSSKNPSKLERKRNTHKSSALEEVTTRLAELLFEQCIQQKKIDPLEDKRKMSAGALK